MQPNGLPGLRPIREKHNLSREKLASEVGCSSSAINQLERGDIKDPAYGLVQRIAKRLKVKPDDLFLNTLIDESIISDLEPQSPDPETLSSLEKLLERVTTYGKRNQYGHKQLKTVVIVDGALLELTDDEPIKVTEARALELLEALK